MPHKLGGQKYIVSVHISQPCINSGKLSRVYTSRYELEKNELKLNVGKITESKEPNESMQLDFWGPFNCRNEFKNYLLLAVDRFSKWPLVMVCSSNEYDKILKSLKNYQNTQSEQ